MRRYQHYEELLIYTNLPFQPMFVPKRDQLGNLLEALGVEVTEERLREAFTELTRGDQVADGTLSFDDFEAWWTSGVPT